MMQGQCIDTIESAEQPFDDSNTWGKWLKSGLTLLVDDFLKILFVAAIWQRRAHDRYQLHLMADHLLKDVAISHADVAAECGKPFWRA